MIKTIHLARFALAASFLSAVASRLGLWGDGTWDGFEHYTGEVLAFAPARLIPFFARAATVCELSLGVLLIVGVWPRAVALAAAGLLGTFALSMAISQGLQSPLDYSVWSACACALLLHDAAPRTAWITSWRRATVPVQVLADRARPSSAR